MTVPVQPPLRLRFEDPGKTRLVVEWRDGHVGVYPLAYLRGWCPCATCQGHEPTHRFVPGGESRVAGLRPVGHYALAFEWADGHSTGLTTWERLRELCPCAACGGPAPGTPP